jgi:hypothetical protein
MSEDLRYPIGKFSPARALTDADRCTRIDDIAGLPSHLTLAVDGLTDPQLDTPYRDDGWTVRQVVHHLADSHANAYVRMRLAATEANPTIKPYDERAWAELSDSRTAPIGLSLDFLEALHGRWTWWMRTLDQSVFTRGLQHPVNGALTVDFLLQLYAWHGNHHLAHITNLAARNRW